MSEVRVSDVVRYRSAFKPSTMPFNPDEHTMAPLIERYGAGRFLWASDYPHADHSIDYLRELEDLAAALPDRDRRLFLGDNVRALFAIEGRLA